MLIRFSFQNFRSFKEPADLIMSATNLKSEDRFKKIDKENVFLCEKTKACLLRSTAIYGANASGKSNVIKALRFMKDFTINSSRAGQTGDPIRVEPYLLHDKSPSAPSSFEVEFLMEGKKYRFGFEANRKHVVSEWLYYSTKSREYKIFERNLQEFNLSKKFQSEAGNIMRLTRPNALFISVLSQFNIEIAEKIVEWFNKIRFFDREFLIDSTSFMGESLKHEGLRRLVLDILNSMDVGIADIDIEEQSSDRARTNDAVKSPDDYENVLNFAASKIKTLHNSYDDFGNPLSLVKLDMDENESDGTKKILLLLPQLLLTTMQGGIFVVDELDSRLHPKITERILQMFRNQSSHLSQVIFTTHDTNLLRRDIFRRDQIWFVEKSPKGFSTLYSLAEIQSRNDANYESDYLKGRYGGIPFINASRIRDFSDHSSSGLKEKISEVTHDSLQG